MLRKLNYSLLFSTAAVELGCTYFAARILVLSFNLQDDREPETHKTLNISSSITLIVQQCFGLFVLLKFGLLALLFKMRKQLLCYSVFSFILFLMFISIILVNYLSEKDCTLGSINSEDIDSIHYWKEILFYLCTAKTSLYLFTSILILRERSMIQQEIEQSPLTNIDQNLTEALYMNIIEQGKNPSNKQLKAAYIKLVQEQNSSLDKSASKTDYNDAINNTALSVKTQDR